MKSRSWNIPSDAWLQEKSHYNLAAFGQWHRAASPSGPAEFVFLQHVGAEGRPCFVSHTAARLWDGWPQGGGGHCSQEFPIHFTDVTWKSFQLTAKMVPSPTGCCLHREWSVAGPAVHGIYTLLPESRPPTLVPILHTVRVMRGKQIAAVTYFQPPSFRKLSHQKLSVSPAQPQKSKQSRSVKRQSRLLWAPLSGPQCSDELSLLRDIGNRKVISQRKSCMKKVLLLLQADPCGRGESFPLGASCCTGISPSRSCSKAGNLGIAANLLKRNSSAFTAEDQW